MNDLPPLPPPAQAALDSLNDELEASLKRMIDAGLGQIPAANSKPANTEAKGPRSGPA